MKRIPKSFTLGGFTFTVKLVTAEELQKQSKLAGVEDGEAYGLCVPDTLTIYLLGATKRLNKAVRLQTFWHEFYHAFLWVIGHRDSDNEKVVDACGHHMKQFFDTVQF
jgi:hypothetical protein